MVSGISQKRSPSTTTTTATPTTTTPTTTTNANDVDVAGLDAGGAETDLAARRRAIDSTAAAIADEMDGTVVTAGEARAAVAALQALPPGDARLALETLTNNGALETLADNVDDASRRALVDVMIAAGFVGSEAGRLSGPKTTTGPQPPAPPVFANVDGVYGATTSKMLHDENLARLDDFRDAFADYRGDYQKAVRGTKSFEALRALGPIAEPTMPLREPGTRGDVPREWAKRAGTVPDVETGKVLTDTIFRLNGQSPPGVDMTLEGTVKQSFGDLGIEGKAVLSESRNGAVTAEAGLKVKGKVPLPAAGMKGVVGTGVGVAVDDGVVTTKGGVEKGGVAVDFPGANVSILHDGVRTELEAKGQGIEAKLKTSARGFEGEVAAEGQGMKAKLAVSSQTTSDAQGNARTTVKGTVGFNGVTATAGLDSAGGMIVGVGIDSDNFEGQLEVTTQLMSRADYARAITSIDGDVFSNPPPELARGVKWSGLSADEQAAYAFYGWNEQSWDGRMKASSQLTAARVVGR